MKTKEVKRRLGESGDDTIDDRAGNTHSKLESVLSGIKSSGNVIQKASVGTIRTLGAVASGVVEILGEALEAGGGVIGAGRRAVAATARNIFSEEKVTKKK